MALFTSSRIKVVIALLFIFLMYQTFRIFNGTRAEKDVYANGIEVTVYYEALCPDSKHFFVDHLLDTYMKLSDNLSLFVVPYGKAITHTNPGGETTFECQHGELECYANKIHACVIYKIPNPIDHLPILTCMIKDNMNPDAALKRCGDSIDIDPILECAKSYRGSELLKAHGVKTHAVKPSFIPTVYIGNAKGNQGMLLKNFRGELCTYFPAADKPSGCS